MIKARLAHRATKAVRVGRAKASKDHREIKDGKAKVYKDPKELSGRKEA